MTWNRKQRSRIGYENLEQRRLLAADLGVGFGFEPMADIGLTMITDCSGGSISLAMGNVGEYGTPTLQPHNDLGDNFLNIDDGSDGMFGVLDQENTSEKLMFIAPGDGVANIVVSSSFGEAETNIEVRDEVGDLVETSAVEQVDGFYRLSLDVEAGQIYELTIGAGDDGEGPFQVTVQFETAPPVDIHVDELGADATRLEMSSGFAAISGNLEEAGDVDYFQFVAGETGEVNLFVGEMTFGNDVQLSVTVFDSEGGEIASGATNEFVETAFDAEKGQTYYISINADKDQTGSYDLVVQQDVVVQQDLVIEPPDASNVNAGDTTMAGLADGSVPDLPLLLQHDRTVDRPDASNINSGDTTLLGQADGQMFAHSEQEFSLEVDGFQFSAAFDGNSFFSVGFQSYGESMEVDLDRIALNPFEADLKFRDQSFAEFVEDDFFCQALIS